MSKSTNTVVYFDWKTVIYINICGKCRTQYMLPMEKSVTFTGACANEIIPSINRSFVYKAKEGCHVRITHNYLLNKQQWLECIPYNSNYSLTHTFCCTSIDCVDVTDIPQTFYNVNSLSDLFTNVSDDTNLKISRWRTIWR